ncbi:hypothetical protein AVEN_114131-1 [Araneus ventricosus]|uniref:Uncharacterized protein n=1 Tax=Araneus ventricosus TaxID=182803 RepID=A0A4Y2LNY0_ARAVE|nr:hypothetical protein AVEN_114131-1 [Araneus ventricosus]
MDAEQLKALIDAMNKNQQLHIQRLLSEDKPELTVSKETPVKTISHIPPFESYEPKKEKFKYYMKRFENYLMMKDVFQDKDITQFYRPIELQRLGGCNCAKSS